MVPGPALPAPPMSRIPKLVIPSWCTSKPTFPQGYDLSYVQDAINAANKVAADNQTKGIKRPPPTVQLSIIPGVDTPWWVLNTFQLCSESDPAPNCEYVPVKDFPEQSHAQSDQLPVPWNDTYIGAWTAFLKTLAASPEITSPPLVSIAVAGPVAASSEMILPTDRKMWTKLIQSALKCRKEDCQNLHSFSELWYLRRPSRTSLCRCVERDDRQL